MIFKRFHGGVAAPHFKNTAESETVVMPAPAVITVPMSQHIGAPCIPTVKVGDTVEVGQIIGNSDKPMSAPVHAGVSGKVTAIRDLLLPNGMTTQAVEITSDVEMRAFGGIQPPVIGSKEDFLKAVRDSGLVGLGGAGFPVHIKLNPANLDSVDTLIINAAECEPFITTDYRECREHAQDILSGVQAVAEQLQISQVFIGIENNKPLAIREMSALAQTVSTAERPVKVVGLPARYPQGAEKVLIAACTGRQVPPGKLPADVGCIVMNVTSAANLYRYLQTGMPLTRKRLTVDGGAVKNPQNVEVIIGTSVHDVLEFTGGLSSPAKKLLLGGPMMGQALMSDAQPVMKQNNAIIALSEQQVKANEPTACIRCGRCIAACPMQLMPPDMVRAYQSGDVEAMKKSNVMTCMECGCCSFSCPAHRPILQNIRMAKAAVRSKR